jgi:predicted enzyme related to lactoylglutathione lyase
MKERVTTWPKSSGSAASPESGYTVWSMMDSGTTYFDPTSKEFMFNLVVDNLEEALSQVAAGGAQVVGEIEKNEYGSFGWFVDPDGNKVELWQPPESGGG